MVWACGVGLWCVQCECLWYVQFGECVVECGECEGECGECEECVEECEGCPWCEQCGVV